MRQSTADRWVALAFIVVYMLMAAFLSERMISLGLHYKQEMNTYAQGLNFRDRLLNGREWVLGDFEVEQKLATATGHLAAATEIKANQGVYSTAFILLSFGFIVFVCVLGAWKAQLIKSLALSSILVAACVGVGAMKRIYT